MSPNFQTMVNALANNFSIILGAMVFYFILLEGRHLNGTKKSAVISGIGFGVFSIIAMNAPMHQSEGIAIDARFVLTMISTIFGGPISGITTAIIASIFRFIKGGVGFYGSNPALLSAILVGLIFLKLNLSKEHRILRLSGFVIAAIVLFFLHVLSGLTFLWFFPWAQVKVLIWDMNLPALLIYPPMTFLMGLSLDFIASRHQLSENQKQIMRELERHNRELLVFNSALHHEFRTPIVTMGGYLSELNHHIDVRDFEGIQLDLRYIQSAVNQLSALVVALTRFNDAGSSGKQPETQVEDLLNIIKEQWPFVRCQSPVKAQVRCGLNAFLEILTPIIENAMKFKALEKPCDVFVETRIEGEMVRFDITDNGIGMNSVTLNSAFRLFHGGRVPAGGIGASLAIAKRRVESIHGKIAAHSEGLHTGSTIRVWLPISA